MYIYIYSAKKDKRNHLLAKYLSEKKQSVSNFFLHRVLIFIFFFLDEFKQRFKTEKH